MEKRVAEVELLVEEDALDDALDDVDVKDVKDVKDVEDVEDDERVLLLEVDEDLKDVVELL